MNLQCRQISTFKTYIQIKRDGSLIYNYFPIYSQKNPDFDFFILQIFDKISQERKGKVKVFFCGSPQLGKIIKGMCMRHRFNFVKENF